MRHPSDVSGKSGLQKAIRRGLILPGSFAAALK